jgi:amino acid adenylation domain-containing protein
VTVLSVSQRRGFRQWQRNPDDGSANRSLVLRLRGRLDRQQVISGLLTLLDRNPVLRMCFQAADPDPVGTLLPVRELGVEQLPAEEGDPLDLVARYVRTRFDLTVAPTRVALVRAGPDDHLVVLAAHPIAADDRSMDVLCAQLAESLHGAAPCLDPVAEPVLAGEQFWQATLAGADESLDLPTDRLRQPGTRQAVDIRRCVLGARAHELANAEAVPVRAVLFAALGVVLRRYTGKDDFLVGTTADVRTDPQFVGVATTPLILRIRVGGGQSVRELLHVVARDTAAAYEHRHARLDHVVGVGAMPYQVMAIHQPRALAPKLPGLQVERLELGHEPEALPAGLDLSLVFAEEAGGVAVSCQYDADIFSGDRVEHLLRHVGQVLAAMADSPAAVVAALRVLTATEYRRAARTWNVTASDFPASATLPELFIRQAGRTPDAPAVRTATGDLSYKDLATRVDSLAATLQANGVRRGDVVGVAVGRTPQLPVCLMAVQRAGAACLPLDLSNPEERLRLMLADAHAVLVLAPVEEHDRLAPLGVPLLAPRPESEVEHQVAGAPTAEDLCYVIYTSGSTGRPKGVLLGQRGRVNNFTDFNRRFAVGPGDAVLSVSSLGFDMTTYDVFGMLIAGAAVVLPDPSRDRDPVHWLDLVRTRGVTIWHSVPALLDLLLFAAENLGVRELPGLRVVLLGGDWIPVGMAARVRALAPSAQVISLGGATEVSMDSTIYPIGEADPGWRSVPYGTPMAGQRAYVLDVDGHLAAVGVPGELYLGGTGLAWGYAGAPGQTATRFVPDPFGSALGARMYRTGDLAKYGSDGVLELLGRLDFQVKIAGNRIELGEVEVALREQPGVEAAVAAAPLVGSVRTLVGYVVGAERHELDPNELRQALRSRLPAYMVPSIIFVLDRLPLTPNGKLDRKALPVPRSADGSS